jgi:hypothetical protein
MKPMRALLAIVAAVLAAFLALAQSAAQAPAPSPPITGLESLPPASQQLARIRAHMADTLEHQPNYTCLETVERTYRLTGARKSQLQDTLRLEVALVDGKEMFAWPGAKKFEEIDLRKMIPSGTFGNGNFALHARSVFLGRVATFEYRGLEIADGAAGPLERYDFHVPRQVSGYTIRVGDVSGVAGFHGSFWAEKKSLDVRRLEVIAEEIPADLGVAAASDRVDYARLRIGSSEFLLPVESELMMTDSTGQESRNHVHFTSCRQYTGESTLRFDDADSPAASDSNRNAAPGTPADLPEADLPTGTTFALTLDQDVDLDSAAVGDPVRAHLNSDLRRKGEVLARKGAAAYGRITRLERRDTYMVLGITLVTLETGPDTGAATLRVTARLDDAAGLQLLAPPRNTRVHTGPPQPGEGLIILKAGHVRLTRGIFMYWRS